MTKRTWVLILALMAVGVVGGIAWYRLPESDAVPGAEGPVLIGGDLPLSGAMSYYGGEVLKGLQLAFEKENGVQLLVEDNHSTPKDAVTVFQMFASRGDVSLVISSNSPLSAPLRQLANDNQIVLLALVTGAERFAVDYPWVFRDAITQTVSTPPLADFASDDRSVRQVAILVVNDDYGLGGARAFRRQFESKGGAVVSEETYQTGETDLRAQLTKLKASAPDALYVVGRQQNLISAIVQARELAVAPLILTSDAFDSPSVIAGVAGAGEGVVFSSYDIDLDASESSRAFRARFVQRFGAEPGVYAVDAFAAGRYLLEVIRAGDGTSQSIRDGLARLRTSSVKGPISVTPDRDVLPPVGLFTIENGAKVRLRGAEELRNAA